MRRQRSGAVARDPALRRMGNVQFAARGQMSSVNDAAGVQRQPADDHLRLVVATMPTQAWSVRSDASIEFVNQPWLDYIDLSAEQAMDWDWKVAIHPDDLSRILEVFQAALTSGSSSRSKAHFGGVAASFAGFSSGPVFCATNLEKLSNGSERIPILKTANTPRNPSGQVKRIFAIDYGL